MIELRPMTAAEYETYLSQAIADYAADKVQAGNWSAATALEQSAREYENYLPQGLNTPHHYLWTLVDPASGTAVGMLWCARFPEAAQPHWFIFDFSIDPQQRRRGYASQALTALTELARAEGIQTIGLHVFGHNLAARALYEKMGFEITNINMLKKVTG